MCEVERDGYYLKIIGIRGRIGMVNQIYYWRRIAKEIRTQHEERKLLVKRSPRVSSRICSK